MLRTTSTDAAELSARRGKRLRSAVTEVIGIRSHVKARGSQREVAKVVACQVQKAGDLFLSGTFASQDSYVYLFQYC